MFQSSRTSRMMLVNCIARPRSTAYSRAAASRYSKI